MKLLIILPSRDSARNAGVRIRYLRLSPALEEAGLSLALVAIDDFDPQQAQCDAVVFSKCYDARALVCAAVLARRRIKVGIDLFDDYFSQKSDSRLNRFRSWLEQMLRLSDFVLCSTAVLADVVLDYRAEIPVHVLSDPAPAFDSHRLSETLSRKFDAARSEGVMRTLWFGMGDNPYFPVGLADLAAFGSSLRDIASGGAPVELRILTNSRALSSAGLALAAHLPVPIKIWEWSEQREAELLHEAFLCFLPVSSQPFSIAKSLNRAVTALAAGCQVLSVGYPLYAPLEQWIYRDTADLLADWRSGRARLSPSSADDFERKVSDIASAEREAESLALFLKTVNESVCKTPADSEVIFLLHGLGSSQSAHHLVKRAGGLSVGTPFCNEAIDFDVVVEVTAKGEATLAVSGSALSKVRSPLRTSARPAPSTGGRRKFWQVGGEPLVSAGEETAPLSWRMAMYGPVMKSASVMLSTAFGDGLHLISEDSTLPVAAGRL